MLRLKPVTERSFLLEHSELDFRTWAGLDPQIFALSFEYLDQPPPVQAQWRSSRFKTLPRMLSMRFYWYRLLTTLPILELT